MTYELYINTKIHFKFKEFEYLLLKLINMLKLGKITDSEY